MAQVLTLVWAKTILPEHKNAQIKLKQGSLQQRQENFYPKSSSLMLHVYENMSYVSCILDRNADYVHSVYFYRGTIYCCVENPTCN